MAKNTPKSKTKPGFTMIEVTLFLAITGLILIGVLGGTYSSIATQRYNDSVRSFAEFLRQLYGEVISPESIGQSTDNISTGDSDEYAIYGKIAVFGLDTKNKSLAAYSLGADDTTTVYTATVVGSTALNIDGSNFLGELANANVSLYCNDKGDTNSNTTLGSYMPLWGAHLLATADSVTGKKEGEPFEGTVVISRSPASGIVHTAYINETFDIKNECDGAGKSTASTTFSNTIRALAGDPYATPISEDIEFNMDDSIGFCIESDNSNVIREVRINSDGRNTSAISILDEVDSQCQR